MQFCDINPVKEVDQIPEYKMLYLNNLEQKHKDWKI